jgi:hypothetical protein
MYPFIKYTFSSEGPSDRVLQQHINWALERLTTLPFEGEWADPSIFDVRARDVATRAAQAIAYYPCNLLFVHRDADADGFEVRQTEIRDALRQAGIGVSAVPIVPVRMTESWLLCSESAIRCAAGRPNSVQPLAIPSMRNLEGLADPKARFEEVLCRASERNGRKLDQFRRDIPSLKYRVAELVDDFEPLLQISAFREFYRELDAALNAAGLK